MKPLLWRLAESCYSKIKNEIEITIEMSALAGQWKTPEPKWRNIVDGSTSRIRSTRESSEDCARRLHEKRSIAWPNVSGHYYIMLTKEELVAEIARVENETLLAFAESSLKLREERDQAVKDLQVAQGRIRSIMHNPSIDPSSLAGAIRKEDFDEGVASIQPKYDEVKSWNLRVFDFLNAIVRLLGHQVTDGMGHSIDRCLVIEHDIRKLLDRKGELRRALVDCEPLAHHDHGRSGSSCSGCRAKEVLDRTRPSLDPRFPVRVDPKISVGYNLDEPMITLTATLHRPGGESAVVSKQTFKVPKIIL